MVALSFNLQGFSYQQGIDSLQVGFATSTAALAERCAKLRVDLQAYNDLVSAGGERIGEWEDGHRLWEQDQVLTMQIEDAEASVMDMRKACVLAAYHHWERAARRWSSAKDGANHADLVAATKRQGYPIDGRLEGVRALANTLKHSNWKRASELKVSWPVLMKAVPTDGRCWDWYSVVELADRHVDEVYDILRGSGPHANMTPRTS
jgi:hypothetical protein